MKFDPLYIVLILAICVNPLLAQNQRYQFTRMNILDNASIGQVNFITEDQHGFIWFSEESNNALTRFDGFDIKRYRNDPNDDNSLGGSHPECLLVDKDGIIWIGFFGQGLDRFDPRTETFTHYDHDPNVKNGISNDWVSSIIQGPDGKIYIATFGGLDVLDPATGNFEHYEHQPDEKTSLSSNMVRELYVDRQDTIWVGTGWFESDLGGLNKFNPKERNFTRYLSDSSDPTALTHPDIVSMFEDSKGNFWVGTVSDGLHLMDRKTGTFEHFPYDPQHPEKISIPPYQDNTFAVTFISEDQAGNLWIGGEGIDVYNLENGYYRHFGENQDYDGTYIENSSWCIHVGSNGLIWISTQPGLYKVDPFHYTIPIIDKPTPIFLIESDSIYWSGAREGLIKENLKSNTQTVWKHDANDFNSLTSDRLNIIYQDGRGDTWVGTDYGLNRIFAGTKDIIAYYHNPQDSSSLTANGISAIIEDNDENLWIGTVDGLNKFNKTRDTIQRIYRKDIDGSLSTWPLGIAGLAIGEQNELWIALSIGGTALRWNTQTKDFEGYNMGNNQNDIHKDTSGVIWIASQSGLYKYDQSSNSFKSLLDYSVFSIVADKENTLWAKSISNILEIRGDDDIVEYEIENVRSGGNLSGSGGRHNAFLKPDGTVILGDIRKYFYFNPEIIQKSPDTSKLHFTEMAIIEKSTGSRRSIPLSLDSINEINLKYNENSFFLSFTEIDYREKTKNRIQYKLNDYDPDWRQAFSEDEISYSNVPPGKYVFQIKASNSSTNLWAQKEMYLLIAPPWWKTWWAYILYGLIVIISIINFDKWRKKRLLAKEREKSREKELAQAKEIEKAYTELKSTQAQLIQSEKMASLGELTAGIAHEIQNPLNFVNNFSEVSTELIDEAQEELASAPLSEQSLSETKDILNDLKSNLQKISEHGDRASGIVKGMLQHSRTGSGEKEPTSINELADEYLRLAYHGLRAKDSTFNAAFETNFDPELPKINVIPQDIGRVFLNLINNAFQAVHEKSQIGIENYQPKVTLSTLRLNDSSTLQLTISDNGPGIPDSIKDKIFQPFFTTKPTGSGTGLGLSLSYDIVKAHGGEINVNSEVGKGTKFIIQLPLNQNNQ